MGPIKNECPLYIPQKVCWCLAVAAQLALCLYHRVKGYTRPGTNPESDPAAAVAYNHSIVGNWLAKLEEYRSAALDLKL